VDVDLPFEQQFFFEGSLTYLKTQMNFPEVELNSAEVFPADRRHLWMR
jgi:hypothetical protein